MQRLADIAEEEDARGKQDADEEFEGEVIQGDEQLNEMNPLVIE